MDDRRGIGIAGGVGVREYWGDHENVSGALVWIRETAFWGKREQPEIENTILHIHGRFRARF